VAGDLRALDDLRRGVIHDEDDKLVGGDLELRREFAVRNLVEVVHLLHVRCRRREDHALAGRKVVPDGIPECIVIGYFGRKSFLGFEAVIQILIRRDSSAVYLKLEVVVPNGPEEDWEMLSESFLLFGVGQEVLADLCGQVQAV